MVRLCLMSLSNWEEWVIFTCTNEENHPRQISKKSLEACEVLFYTSLPRSILCLSCFYLTALKVPAGSVWPKKSTSDGWVWTGRQGVSLPSFDMMPVATTGLLLNSLIPVAFCSWFCLSLGSFSTLSSSFHPFCHRVEMAPNHFWSQVSPCLIHMQHQALLDPVFSFWGFKSGLNGISWLLPSLRGLPKTKDKIHLFLKIDKTFTILITTLVHGFLP